MTDSDLAVSTINLRLLGAVSLFASDEETRYYLNGVCIEVDARGTTYVATDGHKLVACHEALTSDETDNGLTGTFIIPTLHCKPFKLNKDDVGVAKMFAAHGVRGRLTLAHELVDVTFSPIDGVFPDWRKVVPQGPASGVLAQFNLKNLAVVEKFAKALGLGVPFIAHNGPDPAPIWFPNEDDMIAVLMPFRKEDELGRLAQAWARPPEVRSAA